MLKKKFLSVPFNGDFRLAAENAGLPEVEEIYAESPTELGGANSHEKAGEGRVTAAGLKRLLRLCSGAGVKLNLLFNSPRPGRDLRPFFELVRALPGLDSVTLSDPFSFAAFRREFPELGLHASVIMNVDDPQKARAALGEGADTIALPTWLNRSGAGLLAMAALKKDFPRFRVKLFANLHCAAHCLYSSRHYLMGEERARSRAAGLPDPVAGFDCRSLARSPEELIRVPFIRPEDVSFYLRYGLADSIKLYSRNFSSPRLRRVCRAYAAGFYAGDLRDLISFKHVLKGLRVDNRSFPRNFAAKFMRCTAGCRGCDYCAAVGARAVTFFCDRSK